MTKPTVTLEFDLADVINLERDQILDVGDATYNDISIYVVNEGPPGYVGIKAIRPVPYASGRIIVSWASPTEFKP